MRIPRQTRILLITDEQNAHRELVVSRRLVIGFLVAGAVALALFVVLLLGYGQAAAHARRAAQMAQRLEAAETEAATATALRKELEHLRSLQERLLAMLGVDQDDVAGGDTAGVRRTPGGAGCRTTRAASSRRGRRPGPSPATSRGNSPPRTATRRTTGASTSPSPPRRRSWRRVTAPSRAWAPTPSSATSSSSSTGWAT